MKTSDLSKRYEMLAEQDLKNYDPEEKMLKEPFSTPGYHTTLKGGYVHRTYDSLVCASKLLLTGKKEHAEIASDIIERVLALQDRNPENKTFGIWSWFLEETLEQMSPPDWNWANFCGKELLQMLITCPDSLSAELKEEMKISIDCCCRSIIRRNVTHKYTNIAVMGAYVTITGGEYLNNREYIDYGTSLLEKVYNEVRGVGNFSEYNSPTYTIIAICDFKRIINFIKEPEALKMSEWLYKNAWECLASHYHFPTKQWSGPHARCYDSLRDPTFYSFLYDVTDGKADNLSDEEYIPNLDTARLDIKCPPGLIEHFIGFSGEHTVTGAFDKADSGFVYKAYTYMTENYSIGSFNKMDLWNQRRNIIGYFKNNNAAYMHLRLLHDDYDFGSGSVNICQDKNRLLGIMNIATDSGDRHNDLDLVKNATISAGRLSLSFEFGGDIAGAVFELRESDSEFYAKIGETEIRIKFDLIKFGEFKPQLKIRKENGKAYLEAVLYEGERTDINLAALSSAVCVFEAAINENIVGAEINYRGETIKAESKNTAVKGFLRCMPLAELKKE